MRMPEVVHERSIEFSFAFMNVGNPPATVLDIGCSESDFPIVLAAQGFKVFGIDIRECYIKDPSYTFMKRDIMNTHFPNNFFDVITAISTIEHLGVQGRYGIKEDAPLADNVAMKEIKRIIKRDGRFIMTVPYGKLAVFRPWHKVYDEDALKELINDFSVLREEYFIRKANGCWIQTTRRVASQITPYVTAKSGIVLDYQHALACLVLR